MTLTLMISSRTLSLKNDETREYGHHLNDGHMSHNLIKFLAYAKKQIDLEPLSYLKDDTSQGNHLKIIYKYLHIDNKEYVNFNDSNK